MNLSGNPLDWAFAFGGGVLVSFTPCVFPLLPVSLSYIGARAAGSRRRGFTLSFSYVSGVAATYAVLGLIASLSGRLFGAIAAHPATTIAAGSIIAAMGLAMLGGLDFSVSRFLRLPQQKRSGHLGSLLFGMVSGLMVGPCTAPALGSILVYLATKKNVLYGTVLLLSFAYGLGTTLLLAGTFGSALVRLPRPGQWLVYTQRFCALVLVGMGLFFVYTGIRRI